MSKIVKSAAAALVVLLLIGGCNSVQAAGNPALNAAILRLSLEREHVKFQVENRDEQEKQMAVIAQHAANIEQQFQNAPAAMIWVGIITSEQASIANENSSPIKALIYARRARNILEKAEKIDPVAVDAGAPTSFGVLYYRVPAFPWASAISQKLGITSKKRSRMPRMVWMQIISTGIFSMNSMSTPRPWSFSNAHSQCRPIPIGRFGISRDVW